MNLQTPIEVYRKWFEGTHIDGPRSLVKNNIIPAMEELVNPYKKENEELKLKLELMTKQIESALYILENKRPNTPGLGAPIVLLRIALEEK